MDKPEWIKKLILRNKSKKMRDIVSNMNKNRVVSDATKEKLRKYALENNVRPPVKRGKEHWRWNNGVKINKGYKYLYQPHHPNCTTDGYVLEHRLIMEKYIGRFLNKKEASLPNPLSKREGSSIN